MALSLVSIFNGLAAQIQARFEAIVLNGVTTYAPRQVLEVDGVVVGNGSGEAALPVALTGSPSFGINGSLPAGANLIGSALFLPPTLRGHGVFTASTSSTALTAALALEPNSAAFPTGTLGGQLTLAVSSGATAGVYVNWFGGTVSTSAGDFLGPGQSRTINLSAQNMASNPPTLMSGAGTVPVSVFW